MMYIYIYIRMCVYTILMYLLFFILLLHKFKPTLKISAYKDVTNLLPQCLYPVHLFFDFFLQQKETGKGVSRHLLRNILNLALSPGRGLLDCHLEKSRSVGVSNQRSPHTHTHTHRWGEGSAGWIKLRFLGRH